MHGPGFFFLASIGVPDARQCLAFATPFLTVAAAWWVLNRLDPIIDRLFPHWQWERKMGWLNIRAYRRAEAVLRWIRFVFYAVLAVALYGIVWGVQALQLVDHWDQPEVVSEMALRLPVLFVCLALWLTYLGLALIPKLRREYEADELEKFRAEHADEHGFHGGEKKPSRLKSAASKPRGNLSARSGRMGPRR